ncbi:DUF7108 family protein [Natronomonas sp. EA1]|uniref:DUF7108 family protein n=1 Tax=Natronomonas sp. EA1 TaxID=3421655 RepID=UPI003EC0C03E
MIPDDVLQEAERLTRLAREAVDENETAAHERRRAAILDEHGYTARVREDGVSAILVLHPSEWVEDGVIQPSRIDDIDRGIELPLEGPATDADWEEVEEHNRALAEEITAEHGEVHGRTAHAFADFMGNHYVKPMDEATPRERKEFREDYFPRNAWPTAEQKAKLAESLSLVVEE